MKLSKAFDNDEIKIHTVPKSVYESSEVYHKTTV